MALTLKYDFANEPTLEASVGPTLTIARASTATVTDYDNVLRTVQAAEARFTGGRRVENVVKQSDDVTEAVWIKSNCTASAADTLTASVGTHVAKINPSTAPLLNRNIGDTHAISLKVKAGTHDHIWIGDRGTVTLPSITVDASAGTITGTSALLGSSISAADADGFYTVKLWWDRENAGSGSVTIAFGDSSHTSDHPTIAWAGTETLLVKNIQTEDTTGQDDPSPSEYQATTTAAVSKWYATKRRTNLSTYSSGFDNAAWTKTNATITGSVSDPDGGTDAKALIEDATAGVHQAGRSIAVSANTAYTMSMYVKKGTRDWFAFECYGTSSPTNDDVSYNVSAGTVGTTGSNSTATIVDAGGGWYRCTNSFTTGIDGTLTVDLRAGEADADNSYSGTASAEALYFYGFQFEKGSTATAYIATTTAVASSTFDTAITATGLLVEEARTNICLQSEDLSTSWANTRTTDAQTAGIAPDGTNTANTLIEDATASATHVLQQSIPSITDTVVYTFSIYVKENTRSQIHLQLDPVGFAASSYAYFDVNLGTVLAEGAGVDSSAISDEGAGWYRCSITATAIATGAETVRLGLMSAGTPTYNGDGTSSIFVWGAQLEAGAFPTSYIPTTTVSVTRAVDVVSTTDVSWYAATGGSFYVSTSEPYDSDLIGVALSLDDVSNDNRININREASDAARIVHRSGGATVADLSVASAWTAVNTAVKYAHSVAANDFELYVDGVRAGTGDQAGAVLVSPTTLNIGNHWDAGNPLNGHIAEIRYYNSRLTNAQLENMSNGIFPIFGYRTGPGMTMGMMGKMGSTK